MIMILNFKNSDRAVLRSIYTYTINVQLHGFSNSDQIKLNNTTWMGACKCQYFIDVLKNQATTINEIIFLSERKLHYLSLFVQPIRI